MTAEIELAQPRNAGLPAKLEYARFLATSGLLPAQYRDRPGNVLYAVEFGEMLGIRPMAAITGVHVIEGKPSASAALISALVRRAGHRLRVTGNDEKAIAEIIRSDDPDFVYRSEWTIARARQAELTGKGTWKKYPAAMLKARAITEVARDACEEALMGMHYTPEELGADVDAEGMPVQVDADWASRPATAEERGQHPEPAADADTDWDGDLQRLVEASDVEGLRDMWRQARKVRPGDIELHERIAAAARNAAPPKDQPADEPVDADVVDEPPADDDGTEGRARRRMHALFTKSAVTREERLTIVELFIERPVESTNDLTASEVDTVVGRLAAAEHKKGGLKAAAEVWLQDYAQAAEEQVDVPEPGQRRTEAGGQVMEWTGTAWRHVTRAELDREAMAAGATS